MLFFFKLLLGVPTFARLTYLLRINLDTMISEFFDWNSYHGAVKESHVLRVCYLSSDRLFQLMHYYKYMFRHGNFISKIKNTGFRFISYQLYVGTVMFWVDCVTFKYGSLEMIIDTFWKENNTSDQMGDGAITTNRLFLVRVIFSFLLLVYCNQERGEEKL